MQNSNETIAKYITSKQQCERELQDAQTQLAVSNSQLDTLKNQAQAQFGTTDLNQLNTILVDLVNQKSQYEEELAKLNGVQ